MSICHHRLSKPKVTVIAITGSNGKTSTKDLISACLSAKYRVIKTQANFNNEIGLPKTLFTIQDDTEFAVVEMGMRGLGQLEPCETGPARCGSDYQCGDTHLSRWATWKILPRPK